MARADDLRADYDLLGRLLKDSEPGSGAAAMARERRILGELLEGLEKPAEVPKVDEVGQRRRSKAGAARPPARRRKSG